MEEVSHKMQFEKDVAACTEDMRSHLPALFEKYTPVVVAAAMAQHVTSALTVLTQLGICTPQGARDVMRRLEPAARSRLI